MSVELDHLDIGGDKLPSGLRHDHPLLRLPRETVWAARVGGLPGTARPLSSAEGDRIGRAEVVRAGSEIARGRPLERERRAKTTSRRQERSTQRRCWGTHARGAEPRIKPASCVTCTRVDHDRLAGVDPPEQSAGRGRTRADQASAAISAKHLHLLPATDLLARKSLNLDAHPGQARVRRPW